MQAVALFNCNSFLFRFFVGCVKVKHHLDTVDLVYAARARVIVDRYNISAGVKLLELFNKTLSRDVVG